MTACKTRFPSNCSDWKFFFSWPDSHIGYVISRLLIYVTLPPSQISSTLASLSILPHNIYTTHICKSYQNSYKKLVDELFTEITMGCWSYDKHPKENLFAYNVNSTTMYEVYCTPRYIFIFINIYSLEERWYMEW